MARPLLDALNHALGHEIDNTDIFIWIVRFAWMVGIRIGSVLVGLHFIVKYW